MDSKSCVKQEWLKDSQVATYYGISRSQVWNLVARGALPPGVMLGGRSRRWKRSDLESHDEKLLRARAKETAAL